MGQFQVADYELYRVRFKVPLTPALVVAGGNGRMADMLPVLEPGRTATWTVVLVEDPADRVYGRNTVGGWCIEITLPERGHPTRIRTCNAATSPLAFVVAMVKVRAIVSSKAGLRQLSFRGYSRPFWHQTSWRRYWMVRRRPRPRCRC